MAPKSERIDEFLRLHSAGDRRLYGYILSLVPNFHDADDIAQECRTRLWQQFDSYESGTDFDAWARAIAYYLVLAHREKSSRNRMQFQTEVVEKISHEFAAAAGELDLRHDALLDCLERVTGNVRQLLQLVFAQGYSIKVAAQQLGQPIDGTYKALWRARRALQECIERKLAESRS
jgi:RNA polymerase sigma-70 factor (ECF subfamily)